jgi:hypothetical protein
MSLLNSRAKKKGKKKEGLRLSQLSRLTRAVENPNFME